MTKKITMQRFIHYSNIPAALIRAVVRQSGGWDTFKEHAPDITNHGIDGGFSGWIYYSETCSFFRAHHALIMELAEELANDMGVGTFEMIQGFGVFRNDPISADAIAKAIYTGKGDDATTVQNVMAWFAAEEVARAYNDLLEEERYE
jgi:hypothetical protein